MAAAQSKPKVPPRPRKRKKRWFSIVAPEQFNKKEVGETFAYSPQQLIGKRVSVSLMNLVGDVKKQHVNVQFEVNDVKGGTAHTRLVSYQLIPAHMKRIVRRRTEKLEDSWVFSTKDKVALRIKPLLVTRGKTRSSVLAGLREKTKRHLARYVKKNNYTVLINDLITSKLRNQMYNSLKKVYPLKACEIKSAVIASEQPQTEANQGKKPEPEQGKKEQEQPQGKPAGPVQKQEKQQETKQPKEKPKEQEKTSQPENKAKQ